MSTKRFDVHSYLTTISKIFAWKFCYDLFILIRFTNGSDSLEEATRTGRPADPT